MNALTCSIKEWNLAREMSETENDGNGIDIFSFLIVCVPSILLIFVYSMNANKRILFILIGMISVGMIRIIYCNIKNKRRLENMVNYPDPTIEEITLYNLSEQGIETNFYNDQKYKTSFKWEDVKFVFIENEVYEENDFLIRVIHFHMKSGSRNSLAIPPTWEENGKVFEFFYFLNYHIKHIMYEEHKFFKIWEKVHITNNRHDDFFKD